MSKTVWVTSQGTSNRSRLNSAGCFDRYLSTNSRGEKEGEKHRLSSHSILLFYEQSPLIFLKKRRKVSPVSLDSILTVQWRRKPRSTSSCNRSFNVRCPLLYWTLSCQSSVPHYRSYIWQYSPNSPGVRGTLPAARRGQHAITQLL